MGVSQCSSLCGNFGFFFLDGTVLRGQKALFQQSLDGSVLNSTEKSGGRTWQMVCAPEGTVSDGDTRYKAPFVQADGEWGGSGWKW